MVCVVKTVEISLGHKGDLRRFRVVLEIVEKHILVHGAFQKTFFLILPLNFVS